MAFCSACGNQLQDGNNICLKCNYQNAPLVSPQPAKAVAKKAAPKKATPKKATAKKAVAKKATPKAAKAEKIAQQMVVIVQQKSKSGGYLKWLETKTWSAMLGIAAFIIGISGLLLFGGGLAEEIFPACLGGCGLLILALFLRTKAQYYDEKVVLLK